MIISIHQAKMKKNLSGISEKNNQLILYLFIDKNIFGISDIVFPNVSQYHLESKKTKNIPYIIRANPNSRPEKAKYVFIQWFNFGIMLKKWIKSKTVLE